MLKETHLDIAYNLKSQPHAAVLTLRVPLEQWLYALIYFFTNQVTQNVIISQVCYHICRVHDLTRASTFMTFDL